MAGITMTSIAKQEDVSVSTISQTVSGDIAPARIQAAIAIAINRPVSEVFPSQTKEAAV